MSRLRCILFDLDGTLIDSSRDITASVNYTLHRLGRPERSVAEVAGFIGDGVRALLSRALAGQSDADAAEALRLFWDHYLEHCLDATVVYDGVRRTIDRLDTHALGIVTNKPESFTRRILEGLDLASSFRVIIAGDSTPHRKPDPGPVLAAIARLGADTAVSWMVGDSQNDIEAGRRAGLRTCGVLYGLTDPARVRAARPDVTITAFDELVPLVEDQAAERCRP